MTDEVLKWTCSKCFNEIKSLYPAQLKSLKESHESHHKIKNIKWSENGESDGKRHKESN